MNVTYLPSIFQLLVLSDLYLIGSDAARDNRSVCYPFDLDGRWIYGLWYVD